MRQMFLDIRTGGVRVDEVDAPLCLPGCVLVRLCRTLMIPGTEHLMVEFSPTSLSIRAGCEEPDAASALAATTDEGLAPTLEAVFRRLGMPAPLGYCGAGVVLAAGEGVSALAPGDRVAGVMPHAEIACIPQHLCAKVPRAVSNEQASFASVAAMALHGVRLSGAVFGDSIAVVGLDMPGMLAVQLLIAAGCRVLAVDSSETRLDQAHGYDAATARFDDMLRAADEFSDVRGVDGVLVAAAGAEPPVMADVGAMCRHRGRITLLGAWPGGQGPQDLSRKELTIQAACAFGPGRFEGAYELGRRDYPYGFVRWSANRNLEAALDALAEKRIVTDGFVLGRAGLEEAVGRSEAGVGDCGGVIVEYVTEPVILPPRPVWQPAAPPAGEPVVSLIGAGEFATTTLMPALSRTEAKIAYVADLDQSAARRLARKYRASKPVTDHTPILRDSHVDAVVIATGHNAHAELVRQSLETDKHVFVENPLAMNVDELMSIIQAIGRHPDRHLLVGFNLRFSRHTSKIRRLLAGRSEPLAMNLIVNAGPVPPEHWLHDPVRGGGRILGQAVGFMDLLAFITGSAIKTVSAVRLGKAGAAGEDTMSMSLGFGDGSVASLSFFANGADDWATEHLEIFSDGRVLRLKDFQHLTGAGYQAFRGYRTTQPDRGYATEIAAFVNRIGAGGTTLIPIDQLVNATVAGLAATKAASEARTVQVDREYREVTEALVRALPSR